MKAGQKKPKNSILLSISMEMLVIGQCGEGGGLSAAGWADSELNELI